MKRLIPLSCLYCHEAATIVSSIFPKSPVLIGLFCLGNKIHLQAPLATEHIISNLFNM